MRVAVIGTRDCGNMDKSRIVGCLPPGCTQLISGGATGIDTMAEQVAAERGIPIVKILPDYHKYGKRAPLVRNRKIVEQAELVIAFWDFHSRGTANAIAVCIEKQVPIEVYGLDEPDPILDTSEARNCSKKGNAI